MAGIKTRASLMTLVAVLAAFYQLYLKDALATSGIYPNRSVEAIGNDNCEVVKGLEACESNFLEHIVLQVAFTISIYLQRL
jgi:hypothetical protein